MTDHLGYQDAIRARRYRPRTGPGNSKEHYRDFSLPKPPPVLKAYCTCPGGDAGAWAMGPCIITGHVNDQKERKSGG